MQEIVLLVEAGAIGALAFLGGWSEYKYRKLRATVMNFNLALNDKPESEERISQAMTKMFVEADAGV